MKSIKKINKAISRFDKAVMELKDARGIALVEVAKNETKINSAILAYSALRNFVIRVSQKIEARKRAKVDRLNEQNTAILESADRADRVAKRMEALLK